MRKMRFCGALPWLTGWIIISFGFQNCTGTKFTSLDVPASVAGIKLGDGQVFDGKLRITHHIVDGFTCEGRPAPESILYQAPQKPWHLIQNTESKCAALEKDVLEGVAYDEATKTALYEGKKYVPPRPYDVSAKEDPNLPDTNLMDGVCWDANGSCSLRAAVEQSAQTSVIIPVVVNVPAGTYKLTDAVNLWMLTPDANSVRIQGEDKSLTILDGQGAHPHFFIRSFTKSPVMIENLSLINGRDPQAIFASSIRVSASEFYSGDVSPDADVRINNCRFENNDNSAGVVYVSPDSGHLQVQRSQFQNNGSTTIYADQSNGLLVDESSFTNGRNRGIVISKNSGSVVIQNSSFSQNYTAIDVGNCSNCRMENITVADNAMNGVVIQSTSSGSQFNILIQQATFYGNGYMAQTYGWAESNLSFGFQDSANYLTLNNSILAQPIGSSQKNCDGWSSLSRRMVATHSIISDSTCDISGSGNIFTDPKLGALADNGGLSQTLMPLTGSPAIDSGAGAVCSARDQRGFSRPSLKCDIGSVELQ
jgi:hypothetical protein